MKKYLFLLTFSAAAFLSFQFTAIAQKSFTTPKIFNQDLVNASSMKTETEVSKSELDARLVKKFTSRFHSTTDASWIQNQSGFMVRFEENGISNAAYLTKKGYCQGLIRYYSEQQLPEEIRHQVKTCYSDYNITGVTEVNIYNQSITAYLVVIDNPTGTKIIRVIDGDIDEYQSFTKPPAKG